MDFSFMAPWMFGCVFGFFAGIFALIVWATLMMSGRHSRNEESNTDKSKE